MIKQRHDAELTKRPRRTSAKKSSIAPNGGTPSLQAGELHEKHPRASARAVAFIVRAYENPHYRAAMHDLADR